MDIYSKNIPFMIAEIGINHNGVINIAKQLIDMAKKCGCDAVKFQKRTVEKVYSKEELDKPRESPWGTTVRDQKLGLEFGKKEYDEIDRYCREKGIEWFASAWDLDSQLFLRQYDLKHNKIASAMLTNKPLLELVAEEGRYTFISTGIDWYDFTRKQLKDWQVKYHELIMGKSYADFYIDDKGIQSKEFFGSL